MNPLRRTALLLALAGLAACDVTGPDPLRYAPIVMLNTPAAGRVTFGVRVTNIGDREVSVIADACSVGYRLVLYPMRNEMDPRGLVCNLLVPRQSEVLAGGETVDIHAFPVELSRLGLTGTYELTILVTHDKRYREVPAGSIAIP